MSKIHAVILVPAAGDPLGLLAEGACGARPPIAHRKECARGLHKWWADSEHGPSRWCGCGKTFGWQPTAPNTALALAWDGVPVRAAAPWLQSRQRNRWIGTVTDLLNNTTPIPSDLAVLEEVGTIILLDVDGNEVKS